MSDPTALAVAAAGGAVRRARSLGQLADLPQGTVKSYDNATAVALVVMDGPDIEAIPLAVVCDTPIPAGARVKCALTEPHGGVVLGVVGGSPQHLRHSTAGDASLIGTALTVRATVDGPTFDGAKVSVSYWGDASVTWTNDDILSTFSEVSLDDGATWLNSRQHINRGTTGVDNSDTHSFGSFAEGSATKVKARLSTTTTVGGRVSLSNFIHHLLVVPGV